MIRLKDLLPSLISEDDGYMNDLESRLFPDLGKSSDAEEDTCMECEDDSWRSEKLKPWMNGDGGTDRTYAVYETILEALSSTERGRRWRKKNPEKVKEYLRKTQKDRVIRNRDRRRAVKRHGKEALRDKDVHHPSGVGGTWRLAKKDHGPDCKGNNPNCGSKYK